MVSLSSFFIFHRIWKATTLLEVKLCHFNPYKFYWDHIMQVLLRSLRQGPKVHHFFLFFVGGFQLIILQNVSPSFHLTNIHMNLQVCCSWKWTILGNIQCKLSQNNFPCYAECPNCPGYVINLHWLNIVIA